MKLYKRTYYIFINELRKLRKHPLPIVLATVAPIIAGFVILAIFGKPEIKDIPFVVVDYDNSSLSRTVTRNLDANGYLKLIEIVGNEDIAEHKFRKLESYYTIVIPKGFSEKIKSGQGAEIKAQLNGGILIYAKLGNKAIGQTLSAVSSGINIARLEAKGLTKKEAFAKAVPIKPQMHILGNPYINYGIYLVPGMLLSILQISAGFSTLWIFRSSRESQGKLLPSYGNLLPFIIGRTTPIFLGNVVTAIVYFLIIFPIAGVNFNASYFNLFLLTVLYIFVSMGIGLAASLIFRTAVSSSQALLVINSPAFVFSGYTFPVWAMPKIIRQIVSVIPVKHYFDGFFPMYIYGKTTELGILPLIILGAALWGATVLLLVIYNAIRDRDLAKLKGAV